MLLKHTFIHLSISLFSISIFLYFYLSLSLSLYLSIYLSLSLSLSLYQCQSVGRERGDTFDRKKRAYPAERVSINVSE